MVESFERSLQELLRFLQDQEEHRRQYDDHLLTVLKLKKKEVNQQDSWNARAYPNLPYAVGLGVGTQNITSWEPEWKEFPLKAFRGSKYKILYIQKQWDDAELLRELNGTYDRLRTWRKWLSLRNVRYACNQPFSNST